MGRHGKNISPQVHGVTRSKREGKAIVGMMKWYGRTNNQKAHWHRWAWLKDEGLCPSNAQSKEGIKGKEHKPKSPHILHATRDKHQLEHTGEWKNTKTTKMEWRLERKKFRQNGACTKGQGTTYLYPANTWEVGHESRYSKGVVWRWRKSGGLF